MIYTNNFMKHSSRSKQYGATLMSALVFLVLITVVGVSASKIAIQDILIAGNDQKQMMLYQVTGNQLKKFTNIKMLSQTFTEDGFTSNVDGQDDKHQFDEIDSDKGKMTEIITDVPVIYPCERQGKATSIGPAAPPCDLYDFQVKTKGKDFGGKDKQHRGAGKMIPNSGSKGSLL